VLAARDSLRARLSLFQNDIDDYIELVVGTNTSTARNVARARIRGIEFEAGYDSGPWFASLGASALEGRNRTDDEPLSLIPQHKVSVTLGHRFLEDGWTVGGRVLAAATQSDKPQPSYPTSGYGILDLFASYAPVEGPLEGWRVDVGLDNVFDHAYRRVSWDSGANPSQYYEVGRNLKVALRAQF
jgi:hemoglobin/transferrin/lactoferrin receptor protein